MLITEPVRKALAERGVATLFQRPFQLPDDSVFEPPCSLKRMQAMHSLRLGAFSFAESGFYFGVRIGRYCSIAEGVQIGRGSHPVTWGSTSPLFYAHHRHVFNQDVEAAASFELSAPGQTARLTVIGHDVRIGFGAWIGQGVTIGDGAVIQPGSVVVKDVPPFSVMAGNPAVQTGQRFSAPIAARLQALAWWRFAFWDFSEIPIGNTEQFLNHVEALAAKPASEYRPVPIELRHLAS